MESQETLNNQEKNITIIKEMTTIQGNNCIMQIFFEDNKFNISVEKKGKIFKENYLNKYTMGQIQENPYFKIFSNPQEILFEFQERIETKAPIINESNNNKKKSSITLTVFLMTSKYRQIEFNLPKAKTKIDEDNNDLASIIENLYDKMEQFEKENKEIKQENEEIKKENKEIKQENKEIKQENKEIKKENKEIKQQNDEIKKEIKEIKQENKEIKQENKEIKEKNKNIELMLENLQNKINDDTSTTTTTTTATTPTITPNPNVLKKNNFHWISEEVNIVNSSEFNPSHIPEIMLGKKEGKYSLTKGSNNKFIEFSFIRLYFLKSIRIKTWDFECALKTFKVEVILENGNRDCIGSFIRLKYSDNKRYQEFAINRECIGVKLFLIDNWGKGGGDHILISRIEFNVSD